MTVSAQTDSDFVFQGLPIEEPAAHAAAVAPAAAPANPLGPLAQLVGNWKGNGFNTIWRPHPLAGGGQDRFLELNLTTEKLAFTEIKGAIPNRGLLMPDISMFGLTYMQQIAETKGGAGLHIEPGIWAVVPPTTNPKEPATVVRMASIPHGTVILAQGTASHASKGPTIVDNNIIPFTVGAAPPPNSDFPAAEATFTELNLATPTPFRFASPGVTQAMVINPNSVLKAALAGQTITSTTKLSITTQHAPVAGGGTANTAFLAAATSPPGGNAKAVEVEATFWIESVKQASGPDKLQLQYTQLVQLDFNGLRWPHVTVATLQKV
ncbi:MAG TPA: heme-binding protein [Solirubrobacteraceae bacterium]|nr:heme-binding protein [Solirubrobacteraceae bacterium]